MENFIVSARKYRPQNFSTVVGQSHITTTLKNAIRQQQLAHAFLFCGPRGVGKTTCARILAKTINCSNPTPEGEACNTCNSCVSFEAGTSLNIYELDAASNNSVDDIRELVEQIRFAPQAGRYRVYIIDEVHMLSASAFNAFLKTLEEPPAHAIFILATTEKHKILPTILSRCQIFDFKRITQADTVAHLEEIAEKEHIQAEKAALQLIAQKSEGCMRDSLSILDKMVSFTGGEVSYQHTLEHLNILDEDYYFRFHELLMQENLSGVLLLYDEIHRKGFEADMVLNGFASFYRNLLVSKDPATAAILDVMEGMQEKFAAVADKTDSSFMLSALNIISTAEIEIRQARNKRLHIELALIKLNFLHQAIELSTDQQQVIKKKRIDGPVLIKKRAIQSLSPVQDTTPVASGTSTPAVVSPPQKAPAKVSIATAQPTIRQTPPPASSSALPTQPVPAVNRNTLATGDKKNLLSALREKYGSEYNIEEVKEAQVLSLEKLTTCWEQYAGLLEGEKKHSAAAAFKTARIQIENDIKALITVYSVTSQKFIEAERMKVLDFLHQQFNNRSIHFEILVEAGEREEIPAHLRMNTKQKFEFMTERYPLVKKLKDRLNLELD
ncbi:MAG: DNA polymerase III subunit gamma/tau [Chitinophagaceae bacterium]|nr:DNA polymerase III subunit gamma/tau [Chitinophagaceae bacterium]MCA6494744.1 DNA polymerase III subunit gamma/tau [Chitinophagaceae bacterium]MCA6499285.1 DNA polymerase III subunit gamma/tau [Chitinophagaceae bacterium]MCA6514292.1 DNA polymerase III subunit gamma/tau [Chitinophagaceae bacterium]